MLGFNPYSPSFQSKIKLEQSIINVKRKVTQGRLDKNDVIEAAQEELADLAKLTGTKNDDPIRRGMLEGLLEQLGIKVKKLN